MKSLIEKLNSKKIFIYVEEGKLKTKAPASAITTEIANEIRKNKELLLDFLNDNEVAVSNKNLSIESKNKTKELLSFSQQRLWLIDQIDSESNQYNIPTALQLDGRLNILALNKTFEYIIERHQVLRTCFVKSESGEVCQIVQSEYDCSVSIVDFSRLFGEKQNQAIESQANEFLTSSFDLSRDLMVRIQLIKKSELSHVLLISMHHIASDGWSQGILINEFASLYKAFITDSENPLSPLLIQYKDYARWQRDYLKGPVLESYLKFWKEKLNGLPEVHSLPLDRSRPLQQSYQGKYHKQHLSMAVSTALNSLALNHNATLFMVLNTALAVLIGRYSNEDDIVIGTPVANRAQDDLAPLVGFFVNSLVLRTNLTDNPRFESLLVRSREYLLNAYEHQQLPFEKLVEAIKPERSLSYSPLFQIVLVLQNNSQSGKIKLPGLTVSEFDQSNLLVKYDLTINAYENQKGITLSWEYATDLFESSTIERMATHFEVLLKSIANNPDKRVHELSLLEHNEAMCLQNSFTDALISYPQDKCIHQLFEAQVIKRPDSIAVQFEKERISYSELNIRANQVANYLVDSGVKPDDLVGLCVERSVEMIVGILAILKAGGAYLPMDLRYPKERIIYILSDSGVDLVLSQQSLFYQLPDIGQKIVCLQNIESFERYSKENLEPHILELSNKNLAYVIYTSGSTGRPKGVQITHQNVCRLFDAAEFGFDFSHQDVWTLFHSISFDFSVWEIWGALSHGGKLLVVPYWIARSSDDFYQLVKSEGVTVLNQTPTAFNQFTSVDNVSQELLSSLRYIVFGGEALSFASLKSWVNRYGDDSPRLINMYGITEVTVHVTYYRVTKKDVIGTKDNSIIGRPLSDLGILVLNSRKQLTPVGVVGEMYVSGWGVARGYLNRAELTNERFILNPFSADQNNCLYRTGDLVRWIADDNGNAANLEYIGRIDHQVKIRGYRIELGEIESMIVEHESVKEIVVVDRDTPKRLIAYVVLESSLGEFGTNELIEDIRSYSKKRLPEYMIPSAYVILDKIPLTPNGKVDGKALPAPHSIDTSFEQYVAPVNKLQEQLCEIWETVLDVEVVGINDNFFSIGGDSILSIKVIAQAKHKGLNFSVKDIFVAQTISALSNFIELNNDFNQTTTECDRVVNIIEPIEPFSLLSQDEKLYIEEQLELQLLEDAYPLSLLQQGMVVINQLGGDEGTYHDIISIRIQENWQEPLFTKALHSLASKNEMLRSLILFGCERPLHLIYRAIDIPLSVIDLCVLNKKEQKTELSCWRKKEISRKFSWDAPLWSVTIHQLSDQEFQFNLCCHHALLDGWSVATLNTELFSLYLECLKNEELIKSKPLPYRYFIAQELSSISNDKAKTFWKGQVEDNELPWWSGQTKCQTNINSWFLSTKEASALTDLSRNMGVPDKSILLSAYIVLLRLLNGGQNVACSVVFNGRPELEGSEKTLGLFLNSLPFSICDNNANWKNIIQSVNQRLLDISEYRHYPLAKIQKDSSLDFSGALFNYVNFHVYEDIRDDIDAAKVDEFTETNYLFTLNCSKDSRTGSYHLAISTDSNVFSQEFSNRIIKYLKNIVLNLLDSTEKSINIAQYIGDFEARYLIHELNDTANTKMDHSQDKLIHELFEAQAKQTPDNIAVVFKENKLTYQQLNEVANQLAHHLREQGVEAETLVGICVERSLVMVVGLLGILKAGGAYVPLDPGYPQSRLNYMVEDSGIKLLLTQKSLGADFGNRSLTAVLLDDEDLQPILQNCSSSNPERADLQSPHNLAYVIYTSGSTGQPKGVLTTNLNIIRLVIQPDFMDLDSETVMLQAASLSFDAATFEIWGCLLNGGRLAIYPETSLDIALLNDVIVREGVTSMWLTAGLFELWSEQLPVVSDLQWVLAGGDIVNPQAVSRVYSRLPNVTIINGYGPTENTTFSCCYVIPRGCDERASLPIGQAINGSRCYVLSPLCQLLPAGVVGELYVGGTGLALGYFNRPELTAERFIRNPFSDDLTERLYKTGDLVRYLPDGNLEFIGRIDDQVKIRGFRIELGEIEYQLSQLLEVKSSVVLAREDEPGQKQLVAYFTTDTGVNESDLVSRLREKLQSILPDYMLPSAFVVLDELPLTPNGKVDKKALPTPDASLSLQGSYIAPESETEQILVEIWARLLRLETEAISVTANFFELGGDSILSIQVVSRASQMGLHFSVKDLFDAQTIRALALVARKSSHVIAPQGEVAGTFSLLPIQREFFNDETDLHHFNQAMMLTTPKDFSIEALTEIIKTLVTHHDGLRLCFNREGEEWQASHQPLSETLLAKLIEVKQWKDSAFSGIEDYANQIQRSLSPEEGVLLKAAYIQPERSAGEAGRLLLVIHHLVVDGVSWRILLEDFERLYGQWQSQSQAISKPKLMLPAKTTSYQQWGAFLSSYCKSEVLRQEQGYWLQTFTTPVKRISELPVNQGIGLGETVDMDDAGTGRAHLSLTAAQTEQLLSQCNAIYRTQINELLLAGLLLGFYQWSDERAIRIDLEGHGREALSEGLDLSRTVGWFTSVYPLVLSLTSNESLSDEDLLVDVICAVKEQYRAIPNNGIGFGVLSELSGLSEFAQLPPSELVFNYLGQFDQVVNDETYLKAAEESSGQSMSMARKAHPLSINGMVGDGCLSFTLSFDKSQYQSAAMQALMDSFAGALVDLIVHCVNTPWGRYSPSDFPLAQVNTQELSQWQVETDEGVEDLYPATGMQQGLLFHSLLERGSYVTQTLFAFEDLNVDWFQQAWQQLVQRHVVFRTAFMGLEIGNAHQLVYREIELPWRIEDLSKLDVKVQQDKLEAIRLADKREGFEVSQAPLMRITLLDLGREQQIIWSHHHALLDGWCLPLVFAEVVACYQALAQGEAIKLNPLYSYRDYAAWLAEQKLGEAQAFWAEQLISVEGVTPLPLSTNDEEEREADLLGVYQQSLRFNEAETKQLQTLAQAAKTTVNVIVQAAWGLLLWRYSGESQVVFGATTSGRPPELAGVEQMVGLFINTLPVVVTVEMDLSLQGWLQRLHQQLVEREAYNYLPLNDIQRLAPVNRSLFESLMVFENYPVDEAIGELASEAQLKVTGVQSFEGTNYGLSLSAHLGRVLSIKIDAQKKVLTETALKQITSHLKQLLVNLAETTQPLETRVSEIEMLSAQEQHYLIHELNDTSADYPKDKLIHELFEAQVELTPDNIAVVFEDKQLTYRELNQASNRLAHYLRDQGVETETLVGICVERSLEMVVGILGILKAGGAYVPLDPSYPRARLEYMLVDTGLKYLLTQVGLVNALGLDKDINVTELSARIHNQLAGGYPDTNVSIAGYQDSSSLAYVIYTSGSTGHPKGVAVEHENVIAYQLAFADQLAVLKVNLTSAWLWTASFAFDASIKGLVSLLMGKKIVIANEVDSKDPKVIASLIMCNRIDVFNTSPQIMAEVLIFLNQYNANLPSLMVSGEHISVPVLAAVLNYCKTHNRLAINAYGPTEATINSTFALVSHSLSIGKPIKNTQVYVLDKVRNLAPFGTVGELYIAGASVVRGYLNRAELTEEKFNPDPFSDNPNDRIYKTGDLVRYLPDGNLEFIGRIDDQVKIRGFRIELGEIESQLSQCESVASGLVLVKEDEPGQKRLVAYVVAKANEGLGEEVLDEVKFVSVLRESLQKTLPDYMLPSVFVVLDELPLTPNGKIDKKALPAPDGTLLQGEYVAPESDNEKTLVGIWAKLLKLEGESISVTANFFELGGHSLLAVRLVAEIRTALQQELAIKEIFESSTIRALAERIDSGLDTQLRSDITSVVRQPGEPVITSFAQQRLWFIDQLQGGSVEYNMPAALQIKGEFDVGAAEQAIAQIIQRHEALRTVFKAQDENTLQIIQSEFDFKLTRYDLTQLDEVAQQDKVKTLMTEDRLKPFDLSQDLMVRVAFLQLSTQEKTTHKEAGQDILLFNMHHIASDGWSMGVLLKEFVGQYQSVIQGEPDPLPPLAIQYADYAYWQREWLVGEVLETQLGYWTNQLEEVPVVHSLPLDYPRPEMKGHEGGMVTSQLGADLSTRLQSIAKKNQLTSFMLLQAGLALVLSRHGNSYDIVIGTPMANRMQVELEPLIGFFVNTLVLRADTRYEALPDYFAHIRAINLDAQANQDIPFEQLVEHCQVPRSAQHSPFFQIMFAMNTNEQSELTIPGVNFKPIGGGESVAKFDLDINAQVADEGIYFSWVYDTSLFTQTHIETLSEHLNRLLTGIVEAPDSKLCDLPMLSAQEEHYLILELNDTQVDYLQDKLIHELFEAQVVQTPDNIAVVFEDEQLTYRELNQASNRLAHYLREQGVEAETLVGICVERSLEMVVGMLGILKAGGAYVPLDPNYPQARLEYLLEDTKLKHLLTQSGVTDKLKLNNDIQLIILDASDFVGTSHAYPQTNSELTNNQNSSNLAYVIYTSGSTGQPKGVMVEHQALLNRVDWMQSVYQLDTTDRVLQKTPYSFDVSVWEFVWTLGYGAALVVAKPEGHKEPQYLSELIEQEKVTIMHFVPSMLNAYLVSSGTIFSKSVRCIVCSGEALDINIVHMMKEQASHVSLHNLYGPTEAAIDVSYFDCCTLNEEKSVPIGKPIQNIELIVLDKSLKCCPMGSNGELHIRGAGLARGYLNQPELTQEKFIQNPFSQDPEDRLYKTGDLVRYLPDGNLDFMGRIDDQVKIRGFRIELGEIESWLFQNESVVSSLVLAREDELGEKRLVAYIVAKEAEVLDEAEFVSEVRAQLQTTLPDYMIPSAIVVLNELPLTPNGKIDKKSLPAPDANLLQREYISPESEIEKSLVDIWANLLNLEKGAISVTANFFELGGHSLLVVNMVTQIRAAFKVELSIKDIFNQSNIRLVARQIDLVRSKLEAVNKLAETNDIFEMEI